MNSKRPDQDAIATDAVRHVATLMGAAAITAPKSGGECRRAHVKRADHQTSAL
jgi:hypothetical protein